MSRSTLDDGLLAGIDLATADARVAVVDGRGRILARADAPLRPPERPGPGVSEQDAGSWWPAVARALREALDGAGGVVRGVAVSATSGTVVLADGRGKPVGPAVLYDDGRWPATERWDRMLDHGPAGAAHAWHASDLIVARLTGQAPPTDWSHALKTGYDPGARRWTTDGQAAELRPDVLPPTSEAGTVCASAAAETSLPEGCPVRLGMTDACAAQLAAGADRPGRFVTVVGTTLAVKGASDQRIDDPPSGVYSHRHPDGWWLPGGASNVGGGSLARYAGDHVDLGELDRQAAGRGPATAVCYPLVRQGERFPFHRPDAEELWVGRPADEVDAYRAVLEGVAFVERRGYERLAALGAPATSPVLGAGAGARSEVWSSIRASALGRPVAVADSADTAFGACILAATGTLHESLAAATEAMVPESRPPVDPIPEEQERLETSYGRFVDALRDRGWLPWPA